MTVNQKILIVADPLQGIITPSYRLATRLIKMGVAVTFATSFTGVKHIMDKQTTHTSLTFAPFSDGHDTDGSNSKQPTPSLQQLKLDFATNGSCAVADIISSAAAEGQPFDNVVYSILVPWAATVAMAHGVKTTLFWCQSAVMCDIYYYLFNGYKDLISDTKNNSTIPISLPGLPPLINADLPSVFWPSSPKEHGFFLEIVKDHIDVLRIAPRVLVNTFEKLETEYIKLVDKLDLIPVGPLIPSDEKESGTPDNCIEWLNTKQESSVVYVSFGTQAALSMDQIDEIASGLIEIRRPFLWVIRDSDQATRLSKIDELQKQGMIVDWCSQAMVLRHQAIGCFVMHGGWNSTTESLVAGVPTVVFPQWSDQGTNGKMIQDVWKTGVRVTRREADGIVEGKEIKRCVEMVIEDNEMTRNAERWRDLAREALSDGGSSNVNLQAFLDDV
ncbi:UDP-glucuronosyl/UDP-glucosyltransferase [Artemisia annua]|uniref:Glycosyltransferase n=1 Tax=Artemisia annua TaxID=35608 RepID=A0A2U1MXU7_ARTAN|nr:UDP-glucuronosyl/UDP-glucosyltransferase [Artemisia annua]